MKWWFVFSLLIIGFAQVEAQATCEPQTIQPRPADFQPGGIILTAFDRRNMWAVHIDRKTRYPLEGVRPCGTNCHLSPDGRWITYLDPATETFSKMRLDGSLRTPLTEDATEVSWWSNDTFLVWSPAHRAELLHEPTGAREPLSTAIGAISVQPGGRWALTLQYADGEFQRVLVNLADGTQQTLGADGQFFSAAAWSYDGQWLAYISPGGNSDGGDDDGSGAEIFAIHPGDNPIQWTQLSAEQIGGQTPSGGLSWSPDNAKLAFWVIADVTSDSGSATLHVLDVASGEIRDYCGFTTQDYTPQPPRLVWSPDSTHLAFGADLPEDVRGMILIALDINTGVFTELSAGLYPALGTANVVAWGVAP